MAVASADRQPWLFFMRGTELDFLVHNKNILI
jgi:hypothetical protein